MRKVLCAVAIVLALAPATLHAQSARDEPSDTDHLHRLGQLWVNQGKASDYDVAVFRRRFDIYSLLDTAKMAQALAVGTCEGAKQLKLKFTDSWTVRVFLPTGDRPAGQCVITATE